MNHGYDSDDDDYHPPQPAAPTQAGPSGLLAQLMGGGGLGGAYGGYGGFGGYGMPAQPSAYDEYFKAYSVAVMGGNERPELMYGGKIVMPPSALAKLSSMDIPGPWTFQLRNPRNPKELMTHSGVLEFIASEGVVHLPAWMMKKLKLNEGDPVRLNGTALPKGKLVKIQAQSTDFLEVSDAKAVLESALRYYSCLTKDDIIEITYNSLTFEFLIIETKSQPGTEPSHGGISVLDTDLEVDFETPKGYVEPARPAPAPVATMASKLKIDLGGTDSADSTRPPSSLGYAGGSGSGSGAGGGQGVGGSGSLESFTGMGQSLSGRRMKGKGLSKKVEEVDASSRINRADGPRIINSSSLGDADRKIPAALKLPAGKFFFGYTYVPFDPAKVPKKPVSATNAAEAAGAAAAAQEADAFAGLSGGGNTLSGKRKAGETPVRAQAGSKGKAKATEHEQGQGGEKVDPWANLGGGNTLRPTTTVRSAGGAPPPAPAPASGATSTTAAAAVAISASAAPITQPSQPDPRDIIDATMLDEDDFWEVPDDDDDDDEDDFEMEDD